MPVHEEDQITMSQQCKCQISLDTKYQVKHKATVYNSKEVLQKQGNIFIQVPCKFQVALLEVLLVEPRCKLAKQSQCQHVKAKRAESREKAIIVKGFSIF